MSARKNPGGARSGHLKRHEETRPLDEAEAARLAEILWAVGADVGRWGKKAKDPQPAQPTQALLYG